MVLVPLKAGLEGEMRVSPNASRSSGISTDNAVQSLFLESYIVGGDFVYESTARVLYGR